MSEESEAHQDLTIKALRARIVELERQLAEARERIDELNRNLTDIFEANEE